MLFFHVFLIHGQIGYFQLNGRIYDQNKNALDEVRIKVFEGPATIDSMKTSSSGGFSLKFKLQSSYIIDISKKGYAAKKILINTNVPQEIANNTFRLLNFIFLDDLAKIDERSKAGLPVLKFYYDKTDKEFKAENMGVQSTTNNYTLEQQLKALQIELNTYKNLQEQQKLLLYQSDEIVNNADKIKSDAKFQADSIVKAANIKALSIRNSAVIDSTALVNAVIKSTKEITKEEFEKLAVDENEFQNKKSIQEAKRKIESLLKRQIKSSKDSLDLKKNRMVLRKELFDLAKYQLEIDRLNARTKEDSMLIDDRQTALNIMQQDMILAQQEIENANNKLKLKDLEIQNKNIMLFSVVIGLIFLLLILAYIYYNYRDKKRINKILEYQNQELEKLSIVASETSNAVVITDKSGQYIWVNKGYTRMFGYELEEVSGEKKKNILNDNNGLEINDLIKKALETGESVNFEFEAASKSGKKIWLQTTVSPILDKLGSVSKLIAIDSDISKIKEAELEILTQSRLLAMQNAQIMDSINYAKRIQDAILPSEALIKSYFPDSFIYFRPRDIVSGDFYWFSVQDEKLFVATVDCTGHGVPGAFMSLIGNSLLNHIVNEKKIYKPSEILKELNTGVHQALSQSKSENDEREDGMDLTICRFDKRSGEVQIACANHTALFLRNEEILEIEGDAISIGDSFSKNVAIEFTNHILPFEENSIMYLFSDGYPDQIGGPKNKKFLVDNFKQILMSHKDEAMIFQFDKLNEAFKTWKGGNKQTDDILVMGIRLNVNV